MSNEAGEELVLTFSLKNCEKNHCYQILINKDNENSLKFETEKLETKDGIINFEKKMTCNFIFGINQKFYVRTCKFPIYSKEKDYFCYERQTVLSSLILSPNGIYERKIREEYDSEKIMIKLESKRKENFLFDYLRLGIRFNCFVSFDYSKKENELVKKNNQNILKYIIERFIGFTNDQFFHVSGFGAQSKAASNSSTSVFSIGKSNKYRSDDLITELYNQNNINMIFPQKKILLSPLLNKIINDIQIAYENNIYYVSFIFLSGDIDKSDFKETINKIIISSYLPLSIIIIGVGDHNFKEMEEFFQKKHKYSSTGMEKNKDNVIFTTMKSHSSSSDALSFCLKELRKQVIEFYLLIKYSTENDAKKNEDLLKGSFNAFVSVIFEEKKKLKEEEKHVPLNPSKKSISTINEDSLEITPESSIQTSYGNEKSVKSIENSNKETPGNVNDNIKKDKKYILVDSQAAPPSNGSSLNDFSNISVDNNSINKNPRNMGNSAGTQSSSINSNNIKQSNFSVFESNNLQENQ